MIELICISDCWPSSNLSLMKVFISFYIAFFHLNECFSRYHSHKRMFWFLFNILEYKCLWVYHHITSKQAASQKEFLISNCMFAKKVILFISWLQLEKSVFSTSYDHNVSIFQVTLLKHTQSSITVDSCLCPSLFQRLILNILSLIWIWT